MAALHAWVVAGFWHQTVCIRCMLLLFYIHRCLWSNVKAVAVRTVDLDNKRSPLSPSWEKSEGNSWNTCRGQLLPGCRTDAFEPQNWDQNLLVWAVKYKSSAFSTDRPINPPESVRRPLFLTFRQRSSLTHPHLFVLAGSPAYQQMHRPALLSQSWWRKKSFSPPQV